MQMTSEQPTERRPKKLDFNLLPPEYLPRKLSKVTIYLVILLVVLLAVPGPLIYLRSGVQAETAPLETELAQLKVQEAQWLAKGPEATQLRTDIANAEALLDTIDQDYETFLESIVIWSEIVYDIDDVRPGKRITVEEIEQDDSTITLVGTATKRAYVYDYALSLEDTGWFVIPVVIESMEDTGSAIEFEIVATLDSGGGG